MGQTLTHGIYLPDEGERNCYNGLAANWQLLDGAVGTVAEHTSALAGKAPLVHTHTKSDITDFPAYGTTAGTICEGNDSRLSDARTPVAHTHTKSDVTDLLNSNFIPSANNSYDLGSSSYQWNNAYIKSLTINGVACGDILTHNASEFVDVSNNQTIGGNKTFSNGLFASKNGQGDLVILEDSSINSTNEDANGMPLTGHTNSLKIKGSHPNVLPCMFVGALQTSGTTSAELRVYKYKDLTKRAGLTIYYVYANDKAEAQFINCNISTNADGLYNIGSSVRRFNTAYVKAINNLNPGALSLPSGATENINTDNWNFSWGANTVTAPFDGYISVACFGSALQINNETKSYAMTYAPGSDGYICGLLPVSSGDSIKVLVTRTQTSIYEGYKFIKASGNVS